MSFGLPQKTINQIRGIFKKYPEVNQVKIYGSRAKGHYRRGSDIDLAFFSKSKKDLSSSLFWELDDLPCPYLFDLIDYNKLHKQSSLKEEIDRYAKVLYKRGRFLFSEKTSRNKNYLLEKKIHDELRGDF